MDMPQPPLRLCLARTDGVCSVTPGSTPLVWLTLGWLAGPGTLTRAWSRLWTSGLFPVGRNRRGLFFFGLGAFCFRRFWRASWSSVRCWRSASTRRAVAFEAGVSFNLSAYGVRSEPGVRRSSLFAGCASLPAPVLFSGCAPPSSSARSSAGSCGRFPGSITQKRRCCFATPVRLGRCAGRRRRSAQYSPRAFVPLSAAMELDSDDVLDRRVGICLDGMGSSIALVVAQSGRHVGVPAFMVLLLIAGAAHAPLPGLPGLVVAFPDQSATARQRLRGGEELVGVAEETEPANVESCVNGVGYLIPMSGTGLGHDSAGRMFSGRSTARAIRRSGRRVQPHLSPAKRDAPALGRNRDDRAEHRASGPGNNSRGHWATR